MGVLYLTGDEWLWNISRKQERCAVPTLLSGFLRIHQLHNGMLAAAPLNQSPHSSGFYSNIMFPSDKNVSPTCSDGHVCNKCGSRWKRGRCTAGRSRPIRSERMVNTAVVSFISVTQSSSLDAPKSLTQLENGLQLFGH